jgi:hypothetical protein
MAITVSISLARESSCAAESSLSILLVTGALIIYRILDRTSLYIKNKDNIVEAIFG